MSKKRRPVTALARRATHRVDAPSAKVPVEVDYTESPGKQTFFSDGVCGGVMPSGRTMEINFYAQSMPVPYHETYEVGAEGHFLAPVKSDRSKAMMREVQVTVVLDWDTLRSMQNWLAKIEPLLRKSSGK